ncbi:MAG: EF-hand domain-containing protein [Candidatus Omnitrophota bacterium]|jgi:hypothetical protein
MGLSRIAVVVCCIVLFNYVSAFGQPMEDNSIDTDFQEMDRDKDGFIALEEMQGYQEKKFNECDKDKNGEISAEELKEDKTKIFDDADKNNDKKISREEAFKQINEYFNNADSDKDGKVSKDEFREYWPMVINF